LWVHSRLLEIAALAYSTRISVELRSQLSQFPESLRVPVRLPSASASPRGNLSTTCLPRIAGRTLARSPICDLLHRRLQPFCYLHDCSGCFRLERLPGGACTHWKAPPWHGAHVKRTLRAALDTSKFSRKDPIARVKSSARALFLTKDAISHEESGCLRSKT